MGCGRRRKSQKDVISNLGGGGATSAAAGNAAVAAEHAEHSASVWTRIPAILADMGGKRHVFDAGMELRALCQDMAIFLTWGMQYLLR